MDDLFSIIFPLLNLAFIFGLFYVFLPAVQKQQLDKRAEKALLKAYQLQKTSNQDPRFTSYLEHHKWTLEERREDFLKFYQVVPLFKKLLKGKNPFTSKSLVGFGYRIHFQQQRELCLKLTEEFNHDFGHLTELELSKEEQQALYPKPTSKSSAIQR